MPADEQYVDTRHHVTLTSLTDLLNLLNQHGTLSVSTVKLILNTVSPIYNESYFAIVSKAMTATFDRYNTTVTVDTPSISFTVSPIYNGSVSQVRDGDDVTVTYDDVIRTPPCRPLRHPPASVRMS